MIAVMRVSREFLIETLHLPKDTEIIAVEFDFTNIYDNDIKFLVSHPDIDTKEVQPCYMKHHTECGHTDRVEFLGWNYD